MYIRTKNKIYKVESVLRDNGFVKGYNVGEMAFIKKDQVLNQSEKLEELCDEFVGVDKTCENGHQLLRTIPYKCANFWNGGVYGAVWCERGLKYVAKMNDKGELELI
jgi:hypothetical protein